ncbi:hypothetical protein T492DRAFT_1031245 [Pavlovales sp. CCMP2436]|nr:hypothetical protein T492DRAFT_1031245 [Pavlovales sp. CCMP2436]
MTLVSARAHVRRPTGRRWPTGMPLVSSHMVAVLLSAGATPTAALLACAARGAVARGVSRTRCHTLAVAGLDAESDGVGPGIYGGRVERYENGSVVIGRQFEDYNPLPGPVYLGGGYTELNAAIRAADHAAVTALLCAEPSLANDISTGGATPLHICGMSAQAQLAAGLLVDAGADLEVCDTWGYTPLQRMATNNLARAAEVLVRAGASHLAPSGTEGMGDNARTLARRLRSYSVLRVFQHFEEENQIPWPEDETRL